MTHFRHQWLIDSSLPLRPFSLAAVLRVAYATASTVQFVSGMSYMAALMLVQEPVEAMAYATLVTLLQVSCLPIKKKATIRGRSLTYKTSRKYPGRVVGIAEEARTPSHRIFVWAHGQNRVDLFPFAALLHRNFSTAWQKDGGYL